MSAPAKTRPARPATKTSSARASAARDAALDTIKGERIDLLAAALIGAAVGAAATLLVSGGSSRRPTLAGELRRGARRTAKLGAAAVAQIPGRDAAEAVREYLDGARSSIDRAVSSEIRDLRKAVRRRRKQIGV